MSAQRLGRVLAHAGKFVIQHDHRIAYLDLGVHDSLAARARHAHDLLCAEGLLVKLDRLVRAFHSDVRRRRMISVRYWFCH